MTEESAKSQNQHKAGLLKLARFAARADIFSVSLLWLIVLLVLGTVAQKYIGLYQAQKIFFESWILWLGGFFPLPGTMTVLAWLSLGLLCKIVLQPWRWDQAGSLLAHGGVLVLLVGGFLTASFATEGSLVLREGERGDIVSDYFDVELAFVPVQKKDKEAPLEAGQSPMQGVHYMLIPETQSGRSEIVLSEADLKATSFSHPDLPFSVSVERFFRNVGISPREEMVSHLRRDGEDFSIYGMRQAIHLIGQKREIEEESNISGVMFILDTSDDSDYSAPWRGAYALIENAPFTQYIETNAEEGLGYAAVLRHAQRPLPFSVALDDFRKIVYPGTFEPQSYESDVVVFEDGQTSWAATISMNEPLRLYGYTVFQASFIPEMEEGAGEVSVFAVVHNVGRIFPYLATIIICLGIALQAMQRMPKLIKKRDASKALKSWFGIALFALCFAHITPLHAQDAPLSGGDDLSQISGSAPALSSTLLNELSLPERSSPPVFTVATRFFERWPILHDGRLKPMDSFARTMLTLLSADDKVEIPAGKIAIMSADQWLAELLFRPWDAIERPIFYMPNMDTMRALGIQDPNQRRWRFTDIMVPIRNNMEMIKVLQQRERDGEALDPSQRGLLDLYRKTLIFLELSRSLSILTKDFSVSDTENISFFGLKSEAPVSFSYRHFMGYRDAYLQRMAPLISEERSAQGAWSSQELELFDVARVLRMKDLEKQTELLRVLPPQWQGATQQLTQAELAAAPQWYAPWRLFEEGQASPGSLALVDILDQMVSVSDVSVFNKGQRQEWLALSEKFYNEVERQMNASPIIRDALYTQSALFSFLGLSLEQRLSLELFYNKAKLYQWSLAGYVISFLLALGGMIFLKAWWPRIYIAAFILSVLAFMPHMLSIILRMMIMDRPPVATLYETIVFVGAVCVLFALVLEARMKSGYALLMAGFSGAVLQFMAIRYGFVGDTMGMLVAVLNTNFWLSTHVLTITIGYGIALIAGLVAHIGAIVLMVNKTSEAFKTTQSEFVRMLTAVSLVALFFTTLGTILGGIWADQSWGRFWGWDPKENGALLIVLWLVFMLHGRLSGFLSPRSYIISGTALCPVVALAWFGVNLLGVGLHSYGFIEGISLALGSYLAVQALFMLIAWGGVRAREKQF